jgi:hypothetical protein
VPRLRIVAIAAASAVIAAGCGSAPTSPGTASSSTPAPTTSSAPVPDNPLNHLVASALAALRGAMSVHLTVTSTVSGSGVYTIFSGGPGSSGGSGIAVTTDKLSSGTVVLHLIEVGSTVYVRAPAPFWVSLENRKGQFSGTELATLAGHWVVVRGGPESAVIPSIRSTVEQFLGLLASDPGLKAARTGTVLGIRANGVQGSVGGLVLWVAASGTPYPVELSGTSPPTLFTFSGWNAGSPPEAPPGAVDLPAG